MGKVIKLRSDGFHEFLDEIRQAYDEGRLKDLVCITNSKYPKGEGIPEFKSSIDKYWFGQGSTLQTLGLIDIMHQEVMDYIAEENMRLMEEFEESE